MPIPGADCYIDHSPGEPATYTCLWPPAAEKEVDDQFVNMVKALAKCTGGTEDWTSFNELKIADVTVKVRGVDYHTKIVNVLLVLDVRMAAP